ncbi:phosphoribosylglycinamide formyltransferase [Photobacterium sagamiensis]|uniref:phosphoribosylglycinamide formyltransferase n=1 Tax=Photobacterium sagamiensis TaxID=2910241 RepID=UPI003D11DC6E
MDMKAVVRTCFVLLVVFSRSSIAAPLASYSESEYVLFSQQTQESKKSFQRSLSGLYSIDSWKELDIAQPYRDFTQLYQAATLAQLELETLMSEVALVTNTQPIIPGVKSEHRAKQKIDTELKGEAHKITDLARGSLVATDIPGLVQAFELLNNEVSVVAVKNRFKSPTASGYRDLKMLVRLPKSQMVVEIQLHLDAISTIKNGAEHEIYEQIQTIERIGLINDRTLSEFELAQITQLRTKSLNLYQDAWQQYLQPEAMAS